MVSRITVGIVTFICVALAASAFTNIAFLWMAAEVVDSLAKNGMEGEATPLYHPADGNENWQLVMSESIAYLAGWQQGANPMAYAIRAAYLWQNGEQYHYDAAQDPPLCWVLGPAEGEGETPTEGEVEGEGEGEALEVDLMVFGQRIFLDTNENGVFDPESDTETEAIAFDPGTLVFNVFEIINIGSATAPSFSAIWHVNDVVSHEEAVDPLSPGAMTTLTLARPVEQGRNAIGVMVSSEADPHTENNAGLHSYLGVSEEASLNPGALIAGVDKGGIVVLEDDGETILLQSTLVPEPGMVVLNAALDGRLVRLTSVTPEGIHYRCATEPVGLAQFVDEGSVVFSVEIPEEHFKGLDRVTYDKGSVGISLGGVTLSTAGGDAGCSLTLTEGSVTFTPTYDFALNFKLLQGLTYARIAARGTLDLNYEWEAAASAAGSYTVAVDLSEFYPALRIPSYPFSFVVPLPPPLPPLPVQGKVKFRLKAGYKRSFSQAMTVQTGFDYHPWARIGAEFDNGRWTNLNCIDLTDFNPHLPVVSHEGAASMQLFIKPEVFIELYTVGGPTFGPIPYGEVGYASPPPSGGCPFHVALGLDAEFGVAMNILDIEKLSFSYNLPRYSLLRKEWPLGCGTPMLTVEPLAPTAGPAGGSAQLTVSNSGDGDLYWSAEVTSSGGWLQITLGDSGINEGTISYSVAPNTTPSQRKGIIRVAAQGMCDGSPRYVTVTQSAQSQLGQTITILLPGGVPLELVRIPAGSFQMGSPNTERSRDSDEGPVQTVTINDDFYMGKYEVTQAQWLAVMESWPSTAPSSSYGVGDNYPAYYVSWNDAQNFIGALNAHITNTGQGPATVRLPSEAEWEYACRAGTQTRFYFGDSLSVGDYCEDDGIRSQYMWYCGNNDPYGSKPVGGKLPNAFGLHDMSGNVWEWCQDWYHSSYTGAPADGSAWESPTGSYRVFRGGSWLSYAGYCRSANRGGYSPGARSISLGFRLAALPAVR